MESPEIWIAPGFSAAGILRQALRPAPGTLLVHQDVLSYGRLPPLEPLDLWRDWISDVYLFSRLRHLGNPSLSHPLISLTGDTSTWKDATVELTEVGREVLAGRANFIDLAGIDEWVGGIHLDSAGGRVWLDRDGVIESARRNEER